MARPNYDDALGAQDVWNDLVNKVLGPTNIGERNKRYGQAYRLAASAMLAAGEPSMARQLTDKGDSIYGQ